MKIPPDETTNSKQQQKQQEKNVIFNFIIIFRKNKTKNINLSSHSINKWNKIQKNKKKYCHKNMCKK